MGKGDDDETCISLLEEIMCERGRGFGEEGARGPMARRASRRLTDLRFQADSCSIRGKEERKERVGGWVGRRE